MMLDVVKIGNSKGVRLPAVVLRECGISDQVQMEVTDGHIVLYPVAKPRAGWEKAFRNAQDDKVDELLIPDTLDDDLEEWTW